MSSLSAFLLFLMKFLCLACGGDAPSYISPLFVFCSAEAQSAIATKELPAHMIHRCQNENMPWALVKTLR